MALKSLLLTAAAVAAPASLAHAQAAPPASAPATAEAPARPPAPAASATDVQAVTVTGARPGVRTSVDRLSYSVANDLQTATGSVADALRNVPGVEVDPQGAVSLRGDPNVRILVDGRPSVLFEGPNRGDALQQLGADTLDRVEVITNPSAALSPEGTGGVINLVTKQTRRAGRTGSIRASVGTEGRWNGAASGSYTGQKLTVSGNAGYRRNGGEFTEERVRERLDPATGALLGRSRIDTLSNQEGGGFANARLGVDYDLNARDRLSAETSFNSFGLKPDGSTVLESRSAGGAVERATDRMFENEFGNETGSVRTSWRRKFEGAEHELTADLTWEALDNFNKGRVREVSVVPAGPDAFERNDNTVDRGERRAKIEYAKPLGADRKLRVGYEGAFSETDYDFERRRGFDPAALAPDPRFSNVFEFEQDVHAVYGTYERPFGKLTAQFGLRLEQADTKAALITPPPPGFDFAAEESNDYFRAYPTLNVGYDLDENRRLRGGFSRRVQRPQVFDLNPFPVFVDEQNFRTGNPRLDPEVTDSIEAAFQYRKQQTFYLATLYYRQASDGVTDILIDRGGGVFETTRANLAESRRAGLELVANGKLGSTLSYNVSGSAGWAEIEPTGQFGITESRSGTTLSARANLSWTPTDRDFFQVSGFMNGEQLQAQGVRRPTGMLNLGYRRKVDEQLSLVFSAQNVLDTFKDRVRVDAPNLRDRVEREFLQPSVFAGLIYTFGGAGGNNPRRRPEPTFDYEQGGGPPG